MGTILIFEDDNLISAMLPAALMAQGLQDGTDYHYFLTGGGPTFEAQLAKLIDDMKKAKGPTELCIFLDHQLPGTNNSLINGDQVLRNLVEAFGVMTSDGVPSPIIRKVYCTSAMDTKNLDQQAYVTEILNAAGLLNPVIEIEAVSKRGSISRIMEATQLVITPRIEVKIDQNLR